MILAPLGFALLASFAPLDSDLVKGLCTIPSSSFGVWLCNTIYYARFWDWLLAGCILTILGFGVAVCLLDTFVGVLRRIHLIAVLNHRSHHGPIQSLQAIREHVHLAISITVYSSVSFVMIQTDTRLLYGHWAMYTGLYSLDFWLYFTSPGFALYHYLQSPAISRVAVTCIVRSVASAKPI